MMKTKQIALVAAGVCAALLSGCTNISLAPIEDRSGPNSGYAPIASPTPTAEVQTAPQGKYYAAQTAVSDSGRTHTVASGDTLYNIGVRYGVNPTELQRLNGVSNPAALSIGQVLRIPDSKLPPKPAESEVVSVATVEPVNRPIEAAEARKQQEEAKKAMQESAAANDTAFVIPWPVRGTVISTFRENRMGIDIAGAEGTPIKAVLDGTVQYVGNNTKGYGNFVIVRHNVRLPGKSPTPLVTVYGNCSKILVSINESVRKGQTIARMGKTESDRVKLRFEVRQGKPQDPMDYLEK
ncbi:MAG TPA: M23 family peptidase [Sutterella sp.]|nr:M23 family peptidase [Sutterella sp.]